MSKQQQTNTIPQKEEGIYELCGFLFLFSESLVICLPDRPPANPAFFILFSYTLPFPLNSIMFPFRFVLAYFSAPYGSYEGINARQTHMKLRVLVHELSSAHTTSTPMNDFSLYFCLAPSSSCCSSCSWSSLCTSCCCGWYSSSNYYYHLFLLSLLSSLLFKHKSIQAQNQSR